MQTQALNSLDPSSAASRKCLRELKNTCGDKGILPTSYALPPKLLHINPGPFASGGYGEVFKGALDGSMVCIKCVRVYAKDPPEKALKAGFILFGSFSAIPHISHSHSAKRL